MVGTKTLLLSVVDRKMTVGSGSDRRFRGAVDPGDDDRKPDWLVAWLWIPARTPRADPS
jgi:hypothetical protein